MARRVTVPFPAVVGAAHVANALVLSTPFVCVTPPVQEDIFCISADTGFKVPALVVVVKMGVPADANPFII